MGELNWYSVSLGVVYHLLRIIWHLQIAEDRREGYSHAAIIPPKQQLPGLYSC